MLQLETTSRNLMPPSEAIHFGGRQIPVTDLNPLTAIFFRSVSSEFGLPLTVEVL